MVVGVAYHASYAWIPDVAPWYFAADSSPVPALVPFVGFFHACRMELFFALSGFFAHAALSRRSPSAFLRERARRLLGPYALALPFVVAVDWLVRQWVYQRGLMSPSFSLGSSFVPRPLHLWFLTYAFLYCAAASLGVHFSQRPLPQMIRTPWPWLLLVAVDVYALGLHPELRPDETFWPQPVESLHFGLFFFLGWASWEMRAFLPSMRRYARVALTAGLVLSSVVFTHHRQWTLFGHLVSALVAWLLVGGALALAVGAAPIPRSKIQFLVDSAYWVYLAHYSVVEVLQALWLLAPLPGTFEYIATVLLTAVVCMGSFAWWKSRAPQGAPVSNQTASKP